MNFKFDLKKLRKPKIVEGIESFETPASESSQKINKILIAIKANLLVLTVLGVSISAFVSAVFISSDLFGANEEVAKQIGIKIENLSKLEKTPVSIVIPGNSPVTGSVTVNRKLVEVVKSRMESSAPISDSESASVTTSAIAHNKGKHKPLLSLRLGAEDVSKKRVLRLDMFNLLDERYDQLLKVSRAVLPLAEEDVQIKLRGDKLRFIETELGVQIDTKLTAEQTAKLFTNLTNRRLKAYSESAMESGLYMSKNDLGAPKAALPDAPYEKLVLELWNLQWKYWIAEDIIYACLAVNGDQPIATAPVKRVSQMRFRFPGISADVSASEPSQTDFQADPIDQAAAPVESLDTAGVPIDRNATVLTTNYTSSFIKGWKSNQLYDVVDAGVELVIETEKIPLVINALSRQNFIVIVSVGISEIDPFEAVRSGYFYGERPVSRVVLRLESIWLREWTGPLMPDPVRNRLGTSGQVQGINQNSVAEPGS